MISLDDPPSEDLRRATVAALAAVVRRIRLETSDDKLVVIEVGCGDGGRWPAFAGCRYTGIDEDPQAIGRARDANPSGTFTTQGLDGMTEPVDLIVASATIGKLRRRERSEVLHEMWSAVRIGGWLTIVDDFVGPTTPTGTDQLTANELVAAILGVSGHSATLEDVTVLAPNDEGPCWAAVTMRRLGPR